MDCNDTLGWGTGVGSDESSLDAAAEAAEAAEEAREKAAEAAALAAVAAAAAERRGGSTMAGEGAKSNMSPPSVGASPAGRLASKYFRALELTEKISGRMGSRVLTACSPT